MREFTVERSAASIRGTEDGEGRGVVFLHAGVADRRSWLGVIALLRDKARCVAYDQRGYGDTTCEEEPHSALDDLLAVLDGCGLDRAVLVGASRGGQIALDAALRAPDRVDALMLVGSAPHDAPRTELPSQVLDLFTAIDTADEAGDMAAVNELEAHAWLDGPLAPPGRVDGPSRDLFLAMNGKALTAAPAGELAAFAPAWSALVTLRMPVSFLVGDLDVPSIIDQARAAAARIAGARFVDLPGTAHLPMLERPSVVADEVSALLARLESAPPS